MTAARWGNLIDAVRAVHQADTRLTDFSPFPDDLKSQDVSPFHIPSSDLLQSETGLFTEPAYQAVRDALVDCASLACWRETYKDTSIGEDFMARFGCYGLIGPNAPVTSSKMLAWVVYMPARLWYPYHHHPGEEMYLTLAGSADFLKHGAERETLRPGDVAVHASNQPHATETHEHPMLAYAVWRNGFDTAPALTPQDAMQ